MAEKRAQLDYFKDKVLGFLDIVHQCQELLSFAKKTVLLHLGKIPRTRSLLWIIEMLDVVSYFH